MNRLQSLLPLVALLALLFSCITLQAQVDLTLINPSINSVAVSAGNSTTLNYTIRNLDVGSSPSTMLNFYLSTDTILDAADVFMNNRRTGSMTGNYSYATNSTIGIPSTTAPGNYYVILAIDENNAVAETDETNNVTWVGIVVLIQPLDFAAYQVKNNPNVALVNSTIEVSYGVRNWRRRADSVEVGIFLSTDRFYSATDVLLTTRMLDTIPVNTYVTDTTLVTIPSGMAPSEYYIIVYLDPLNVQQESDESNNTANESLFINATYPDLRINQSNLSVDTIAASQSVTVISTVVNDGGLLHNSCFIRHYLSTDSVYDNSDLFLADIYLAAFAATSQGTASSFVNIPTNTAGGNYYIISQVDFYNTVTESNEWNNYTAAPLYVAPAQCDWRGQTLYFGANPNTIMLGDVLPITGRIGNQGAVASPATTVNYYFSVDDTYDSSDSLIASLPLVPISPNLYTDQPPFNYTIPTNLAYGRYHLIGYVDQMNAVPENNEGNNEWSIPITVIGTGAVDLVVRNVQGNAATASPNGLLEVQAEVHNIGQNSSFQGDVAYFFSMDTLYDSGDTYLARDNVGSLAPNGFQSNWELLNLPTVPTYGTYYILFYADYYNRDTEADETNNVGYLPILIDTLYNSDLVVQSHQSGPDTIKVGDRFMTISTVINNSTSVAASSNTKYFLSKDTVYNLSDYVLRSGLSTRALAPLQAYRDSLNYSMPTDVAPGDYYVITYADARNLIQETNESNNIVYRPNVITVVGDSLLQVDITLHSDSLSKDSVELQESVQVYTELRKSNFRAARNFELAYYLSTDSIYDPSDTLLATKNIVTLVNPSTVLQQVNIPQFLPLGQYYIIVHADYTEQIPEYLETNNFIVTPIHIVQSYPELSIPSTQITPSTVVSGEALIANCTVNNTNVNVGSGAHYIGYYLSSDNVYDATDLYLGEGYIDTIDINDNNKDTVLLQIPLGTPSGTYTLFFYADHRNQQWERDETNNITGRTVVVTLMAPPVLAPDLVVQTPFLGHTTRAPSDVTSIGAAIRNIGTSLAFSNSFGIYLSTTPNYNSGMVLLASSYVPNLPVNNSTSSNTVGMIPANTPAGNYHIIYFADRFLTERESNEHNNIVSRPITITGAGATIGDLIVNNPTLSLRTIPAGKRLSLTSNIRNQGPAIDSSAVGYYLSTDLTLSSNDILLGSTTTTALPFNGGSHLGDTITIPVTTTPGNYFILFKADYQNERTERDETNNVVGLPLYVEVPVPDLVVQTGILGRDTIDAGDFLNVNCRVVNNGAGPIGSSNVGYYLSTSPNYTSNALRLGAKYVDPLGSGASERRNHVVSIPPNTASGNYYLLFYADDQDFYTEQNETNNVWASGITIIGDSLYQSDLIVEQPSIGASSLIVGEGTIVNCRLKNQGAFMANSSQTGYYLSSDTLLDNNDVLIGNSLALLINSNDTLFQAAALTIPVTTTIGTYYVLYVADYLQVIPESNENNNGAYLSLTIAPSQADLVVPEGTATPTAVLSGAVMAVNSLVYNQGSSTIANTALGYYLSTDTLYDNNDVYLGNSPIDSLNAGDSSRQQTTVTIPTATNTGAYYLLFYADHQVSRAEIDKTNNIRYAAITITYPEPDLVMEQANASRTTITVGASTNLSALLKNEGVGSANTSHVGYYLSIDTLYDNNDVLLSRTINNGLGANSSLPIANTVIIPANTPAGNYHLLFYADAQNEVAESNENNNVQSIAVTVVLPLSDLEVNTISVTPTTTTAGSVVNLFSVIENNSVRPVGAHRLGYYLTTAPIFSNAIPLGDTLISGLGSHGIVQQSMNVTIPANLPVGNYYLLFYIDDQFAITESSEINNRVYIPITITPVAGPDAIVQNATVNPSSSIIGGTVTLTSEVKNIGTMVLASINLDYYLSPTSTFDSSTAVFLGSEPVSGLFASMVSSETTAMTIPGHTIPGNYHILFYADGSNIRTESNENNNIVAQPITITDSLPDLVVQNPMAVQLNNSFQVSALVTNNSNRSIGATSLGYYLSTNPIYDASDVYLGADVVNALLPNANSFEDATWPIPAGTLDGGYYILFVADDLQAETEQEEGNNIASAAVFVTIGVTRLSTANWTIYPNPTSQAIQIDLGKEQEDMELRVYNPLGQLVHIERIATATTISVALEGPTGVYLLQVRTKDGDFEAVPIVKE
ncbi:MAG: CARDB domain-containing protein [Aureispira sp.]